MDDNALQQWAEGKYGSTVYSDLAYYEISADLKNSTGLAVLKKVKKLIQIFITELFHITMEM